MYFESLCWFPVKKDIIFANSKNNTALDPTPCAFLNLLPQQLKNRLHHLIKLKKITTMHCSNVIELLRQRNMKTLKIGGNFKKEKKYLPTYQSIYLDLTELSLFFVAFEQVLQGSELAF